MDAHCNATFENVVFRGFYPGKNKFTVRGTDKANVQLKHLVAGDQVIDSREDLAKRGFRETREAGIKVGLSGP